MVNCYKCPRVRKCGDDVFFCPFYGENPCLHGLHKFEPPKAADEPVMVAGSSWILRREIPRFKPLLENHRTTVDWKSNHERIFQMHFEGKSCADIALAIGTRPQNVYGYIMRYMEKCHE